MMIYMIKMIFVYYLFGLKFLGLRLCKNEQLAFRMNNYATKVG